MIIKPKRLKEGDTIGIIPPARFCSDKILVESKEALTRLGFKVKTAENIQERYGYLAGQDISRAKALMQLFTDKQVDAIWCTNGGFGCTKILDHLNFSLIEKNPKIFIGFSDITALHIPFNNLCRMVTFLGPTLNFLFQNNLNQCLDFLMTPEKTSAFNLLEDKDFYIIKKGITQGPLVGGNLALICSLIGTPYQLDTDGKILILEDVNEPVYKIERMLQQLKSALMLKNLKGLILASFKNCEDLSLENFSLKEIFFQFFQGASYPVIVNFPCGHIDQMLTLPLSSQVELNTYSKKLHLLENCFSN